MIHIQSITLCLLNAPALTEWRSVPPAEERSLRVVMNGLLDTPAVWRRQLAPQEANTILILLLKPFFCVLCFILCNILYMPENHVLQFTILHCSQCLVFELNVMRLGCAVSFPYRALIPRENLLSHQDIKSVEALKNVLQEWKCLRYFPCEFLHTVCEEYCICY